MCWAQRLLNWSAISACGWDGILTLLRGAAWCNAMSQPFRFSGAHLAAQLFFQQFSSAPTNTRCALIMLRLIVTCERVETRSRLKYANLFIPAVGNRNPVRARFGRLGCGSHV